MNLKNILNNAFLLVSASAASAVSQPVAKAQDYVNSCFSNLTGTIGSIQYGNCMPQPIIVHEKSTNNLYRKYMSMAISAAMPAAEDVQGCGESDFNSAMINFQRAKSQASTLWEAKEALRGHKAAWMAKHVSDRPQEFPALNPYSTWVSISGIRSMCD